MKYIQEFRDPVTARGLITAIAREVKSHRTYQLMEFCGGHTHVIHRYGLPDLLPDNLELIHGPGCPVCVLPTARLDQAIALAELPDVILCTYGDMLRVPGSQGRSLLKAKAAGAKVQMVYSSLDAISMAQRHPDKQVIFFAIGFETTTPPTASAIQTAKRLSIKNFSVFCNHVLTPPALLNLLQTSDSASHLDGFIGPAHVSIVIGSDAYRVIATQYQKPIVIAGFEPLDLLQAILLLIQMVNRDRYGIENQYSRAVNTTGNVLAQSLMAEVFRIRPVFEWRGLGFIPNSALQLNPAYRAFDAEQRFSLASVTQEETSGCECGAILRGLKKPRDCQFFATHCTPDHPLGACMVSAEGACAAYYAYRRSTLAGGAHVQ